MDTYGYVVCVVAALICFANAVILITLNKTKTFKTPIKFHLGLIAIFESCSTIFLSLRIILEAIQRLNIVSCQAILGCVGFAATALLCTNISMSYECLAMLKTQYIHRDLRYFTKRGIAIVIVSVILLGFSTLWFSNAKGEPPEECMVIYSAVYSPAGLKFFYLTNLHTRAGKYHIPYDSGM